MKVLLKVEKSGLRIPMDKLKGIAEGDIVEIEIEKIYMSDKVKKALFHA